MILLDPKHHDRPYPDSRSSEIMRKTIEFFENKGKTRLLEDYYARPWYTDFLEFTGKERIFTSTPAPWRSCGTIVGLNCSTACRPRMPGRTTTSCFPTRSGVP